MDIPQIRKLMRLIENSDVTEIEVTEGEQTVRISRQSAAPMMMPAAPQPAYHQTPADAAPTPNEEKEHLVKSPMVGTFYRASSPDAEPYASEGSKVKKGDTLCIIEAMKLMNEIEAEYDGIVQEVLVDNASPVEYGQPMFVITPL